MRARSPSPHPPIDDPEDEAIGVGGPASLAAIAALPAPILLRDPCGRIVYSNAAARAALGAVDNHILTRIRRSTSNYESSLFLLCADGRTRRRVSARTHPVPGPDGLSLDLLVVSRDDHLDANEPQPVQLKDAVLAYTRPDAGMHIPAGDAHHRTEPRSTVLSRPHGRPAAEVRTPSDLSGLAWIPSRTLVAQVLRRVRRHRKGAAVHFTHDLPRTERRTRASEIGLTRIILSALQILGDTTGTANISARFVGCRLRIRLSGSAKIEGRAAAHQAHPPARPPVRPDLQRNQALLRELRPLIRALSATLELVHDQAGGSRVYLTVPTAEPIEPHS